MIKYLFRFTLILLLSVCMTMQLHAKENIGQSGKASYKSNKLADACDPGTAQTDLDINNVRTRMLAGGDMWWDLSNAKYEIPKIEPGSGDVSIHSLFAGALWIGGVDAGGQLKIAAQTYRQSGNDFWPGPLSNQGTVDDAVCLPFDKHWKVLRSDIDKFIEIADENGGTVSIGQIPKSILEWPGRGNPHAIGANGTPLNLSPSKNLAPFVDYDNDGLYNPENGDYPDVAGDQALWWVYNDRGDIHSETGGEAIGLEIQCLAFGFATNDEINDMTFYKYKVFNYATSRLDSVYFGQWVDPDLGLYTDDFVGCDPSRALGICYNGDAVDGPSTAAYGANPPLVGVDFFQGPRKYLYNGSGDIIDSVQLGMSKFLYYNNDFTVIGNPEVASHFYGYLSGSWKNGSPFTYGGNGFNTGAPTDFMFPDDPGDGGWSECDIPNTPADRRFMQSSGAFRLEPGSNNEVVVGVVWVRPTSQVGCFADFDALRIADDKAQALFDNNFKLIDGPDAPDLEIRELDREIIISLSNKETSNNYNEAYEETDPIIKSIVEGLNDPDVNDSTYDFQGYIIYQLKNALVSSSEYRDINKSRIIAQVDLKDNVEKLVNFTYDQNLGADVPTLMVAGSNGGVNHTFRVTEDAFASGAKGLVNHKAYYFSVVSYASNNYIPYDASDPQSQRKPYLEGRKNIKLYTAIPHISSVEVSGTTINAEYGDGPELRRVEGRGNGGQILDLTDETVNEILANNSTPHPVYQKRLGPVNIKVYDPMKVPNADFEFYLNDTIGTNKIISSGSVWRMVNKNTGEVVYSDMTIARANEQLIPQWGLSVTVTQTSNPGDANGVANNGFLEGTKTYADADKLWLTSVPDGEQTSVINWIRAGTYDNDNDNDADDYIGRDDNEVYEDVVDGTWAPFGLFGGLQSADHSFMPARNIAGLLPQALLDSLASIDIVFTKDKSKWTRCVVAEMSDDPNLAQGSRYKLAMRDHASLNKDGTYDASDKGRSWFPGYAINVETGQRLNIIFSEDSGMPGENGDDMIWNPTATLVTPIGAIRFGGKHYIYIINTKYDEGAAIQAEFNNDISNTKNTACRNVYKRCIWGSEAMLSTGFKMNSMAEGLVPSDAKIRLRVQKPYAKHGINGENASYPMYSFSTNGLAPSHNELEVAKNALDLIKAVPNPYYAYSEYEKSQLDNRIKITNLPAKCTVTIYSPDGVVIRRFNREVPDDVSDGGELAKTNFDTAIDWDLKNFKNIPVASGLYLIHISAPGIGEKVIKWFGVMRPIDLDTF